MTAARKCRHCGVPVVEMGPLFWHSTDSGMYRACRDAKGRLRASTMAEPEEGE